MYVTWEGRLLAETCCIDASHGQNHLNNMSENRMKHGLIALVMLFAGCGFETVRKSTVADELGEGVHWDADCIVVMGERIPPERMTNTDQAQLMAARMARMHGQRKLLMMMQNLQTWNGRTLQYELRTSVAVMKTIGDLTKAAQVVPDPVTGADHRVLPDGRIGVMLVLKLSAVNDALRPFGVVVKE